MSDFDLFWSSYPRRESKSAAMREYIHARRLVSAETIMAGLARYLNHLPRERDYIKKPQNWLRDGDWDNEYDVPLPAVTPTWQECDHDPRCNSKAWCAVLRQREKERSA